MQFVSQIGSWRGFAWLICLTTFFCRPALATTVKAYAMEDLVSESDSVVIGRAVKIEHHKDERGKIVRSVNFKVDQYITGKGSSEIVLRLAGGTIGNVRTRVFGELDLTVNETVLLFVARLLNPRQDIYYPVGMGQGRFLLMADAQTGKRFVTQTVGAGLNLVDEIQDDPMGIGRNGVCIFVSLERFVERIHTIRGTTKAKAGE